MNLYQRLRAPGALMRLFHEVLRFGSVGMVGFLLDVGLFNFLAYGNLAFFAGHPMRAKVMSVGVATVATWAGNRYWTYRHRRGQTAHRELVLFTLFSLGGMVISVGCLWISHYMLHLTSPLADNIAANVVGLGLATAFRFVTYRTFVFHSRGVESVSVTV